MEKESDRGIVNKTITETKRFSWVPFNMGGIKSGRKTLNSSFSSTEISSTKVMICIKSGEDLL